MTKPMSKLAIYRACLVVLAFGLASQGVFSVDDNEAARIALRDGKYKQVVSLTSLIATREPGSAINWYRLAIAATRTGDPALGLQALNNARQNDPSLSFASSPQRVKSLQDDIERALRNGLAQSVAPVTQSPVADDGVSGQLGAGVGQARIEPRSSGESDTLVSRKLAELDRKLERLASGIAAQGGAWQQAQAWIVGFLLLSVVGMGAFATIITRRARDIREVANRRQIAHVAGMPLSRMIVFSRDLTAMLQQRLQHHGREDTALARAIIKYLPEVELEAGRASVSVKDATAGVRLIDDMSALAAAKPVLGKQGGAALHKILLDRATGRDDGMNRR